MLLATVGLDVNEAYRLFGKIKNDPSGRRFKTDEAMKIDCSPEMVAIIGEDLFLCGYGRN